MTATANQDLVRMLQQHCQNQPGASRVQFKSGIFYAILGWHAQAFTWLIPPEKPTLLVLRCETAVFEELQPQYPAIRLSQRGKSDSIDWQWVEIALDGFAAKDLLLKLIDRSYQLVFDSMAYIDRLMVDLFHPQVALGDVLPTLIKAFDLSHRSADIHQLPQPSIQLITQSAAEDTLTLGRSKIGGVPDLPEGWNWPTYKQNPLAFLAQVNLSEIPQSIDKAPLPDSGILYFFSVYGWEKDDGDVHPHIAWQDTTHPDFSQVLFFSGGKSDLERRQKPSGIKTFDAASVDYVSCLTLPSTEDFWRDPTVEHLSWTEEEFTQFEDLGTVFRDVLHEKLGITDPSHSLLGYASPIQTPVTKPGQHLLCAINGDYHAGMEWGDGGTIYFVIDKDAMDRLDFSDVTSDFQCG